MGEQGGQPRPLGILIQAVTYHLQFHLCSQEATVKPSSRDRCRFRGRGSSVASCKQEVTLQWLSVCPSQKHLTGEHMWAPFAPWQGLSRLTGFWNEVLPFAAESRLLDAEDGKGGVHGAV